MEGDGPNQNRRYMVSHTSRSCRRRPLTPGVLATTYIALSADHLLAVELGGKGLQGGLDDTTGKVEDKVKGGLL